MSIPDYQTIMLPLLRYVSDRKEHASREPVDPLAAHFDLSETDRQQMKPSGGNLFADRIAWALTYMRQAGLIETTRRGFFMITPRGIAVLETHPERVDNRVLAQFPEFQEFLLRKVKAPSATPVHDGQGGTDPRAIVVESAIQERQTPSELLDDAYQTLRQELGGGDAQGARCPEFKVDAALLQQFLMEDSQ
jgi:restriction system protein